MPSQAMQSLNNNMALSYDRENRSIPRLFARRLVALLAGRVSSGGRATTMIHDNACGPAVFTSELISSLHLRGKTPYPAIMATDISAEMIGAANDFIKDNNLGDNVDARVMDSTKLDGQLDGCFDISVTNFGIWLTGNPAAALAEVFRTLKPDGGVAVMTAWKSHGWLDLMRRISLLVRPGVEPQGPLANRFQDEERVKDALVRAGFEARSVEVEERTELLRWEGGEDLRALMREGDFARFVMKDWESTEKDAVPDAIAKALTDGEKAQNALAMTAWVITALK